MKTLFMAVLLAVAIANPTPAQVSQAQYDSLKAQISVLTDRLRAVESRAGLGRTIRADTLILGPCTRDDIGTQLAICGLNDANIFVESNLSGGQYQNASSHTGMWTLAGDGGMRIIQNGYITTKCVPDIDPTNGVHYTNCLKRLVDPTREYGVVGFDSRAELSLQRVINGVPHEYTQDLVFTIDPETKTISLESWQTAWHFAFVTSSCRACRDIHFAVPLKP